MARDKAHKVTRLKEPARDQSGRSFIIPVNLVTDVSGVLPANKGGTGLSSYAVGDLIYASAPTTLSRLADVAVGQLLSSGGVGVAPSWSASPTLTTSLTTPLVIGGVGATSTLILRSTSGLGAAGADIVFQTGTNGATEALRVFNSGSVALSLGPHRLGVSTGAFDLDPQVQITGTYTSPIGDGKVLEIVTDLTATNGGAWGVIVAPFLRPAANRNGAILQLEGRLFEASSGVHGRLSMLEITPGPTFVAGTAATTDAQAIYVDAFSVPAGTTTAASLRIVNGPSGATNNFAIKVDGGASSLGGQVSVPSGTGPSAPSFAFIGDLNTGIYSDAPDFLQFATGGAERLRLNSGGEFVYTAPASANASFNQRSDTGLYLISNNPSGVRNSPGHVLRGLTTAGGNVDFFHQVISSDTVAAQHLAIGYGTGGGTILFAIQQPGNVGLGTVAFPTSGTKGLVFGDGTALSGMGLNTAGLYADDVSGTVNLFAINEADALTRLTGPFAALTANRAELQVTHATTLLSGLTGATATATALVPAGSFVLGVTVRVTTTITGATSFDVGDGVDVDRWGAAIALPAGTTTSIANFTANGFGQFTAANNVVLTANGANFTGGAVRITVHYFNLQAATN